MRKTALLFTVLLSFVITGCAGGNYYHTNKNLRAKIAVKIQRQIYYDRDNSFTIYADSLSREDDTLVFKCPCYNVLEIGRNSYAVAEVLGDSLKLRLLPGAPYIITTRDLVKEK